MRKYTPQNQSKPINAWAEIERAVSVQIADPLLDRDMATLAALWNRSDATVRSILKAKIAAGEIRYMGVMSGTDDAETGKRPRKHWRAVVE